MSNGKPMDRRRRKIRIPIGIEKVLCAAAGDREFREQLLMARADALEGTGLEISDAEAMILKSVSEDALRTMIESIDLKRHKRRRFFRGIAAASLAATTATLSSGCQLPPSVGIDPKYDTSQDSEADAVIDVEYNYADRGITDSEGHSDEFSPPDTVDIPQVADELDVDVQPMPAGIPPTDVTDE